MAAKLHLFVVVKDLSSPWPYPDRLSNKAMLVEYSHPRLNLKFFAHSHH